jgi:hypothetical protein
MKKQITKHPFLLTMFLMLMTCSSAIPCNKGNVNLYTENNHQDNRRDNEMGKSRIKIKVNSKSFTATLLDNNSAKAFKEMLPTTINMVELNGNEKYFDLSKNVPASSSNPGTIQNGDLMLYGSRTLVLFYKTFSTSYSYTTLGRIDDTQGLEAALGSGNVSVTIERE